MGGHDYPISVPINYRTGNVSIEVAECTTFICKHIWGRTLSQREKFANILCLPQLKEFGLRWEWKQWKNNSHKELLCISRAGLEGRTGNIYAWKKETCKKAQALIMGISITLTFTGTQVTSKSIFLKHSRLLPYGAFCKANQTAAFKQSWILGSCLQGGMRRCPSWLQMNEFSSWKHYRLQPHSRTTQQSNWVYYPVALAAPTFSVVFKDERKSKDISKHFHLNS